mmetsp:Transcript_12726/g.24512  ORF Transcript_12726/g.24512 Transcript_12726/m.24512 type:complete len:217 (-) Transcript_12726:369-1019(-)
MSFGASLLLRISRWRRSNCGLGVKQALHSKSDASFSSVQTWHIHLVMTRMSLGVPTGGTAFPPSSSPSPPSPVLAEAEVCSVVVVVVAAVLAAVLAVLVSTTVCLKLARSNPPPPRALGPSLENKAADKDTTEEAAPVVTVVTGAAGGCSTTTTGSSSLSSAWCWCWCWCWSGRLLLPCRLGTNTFQWLGGLIGHLDRRSVAWSWTGPAPAQEKNG